MSTVDTDNEIKQLSLFDAVIDRSFAILLMTSLVFWAAVGTALYFIF